LRLNKAYITAISLVLATGFAWWMLAPRPPVSKLDPAGAPGDQPERTEAVSTMEKPAAPERNTDGAQSTSGLARVSGVVQRSDTHEPITSFLIAYLQHPPKGRAQWRGILGSIGPDAGLFGRRAAVWVNFKSPSGKFTLDDIPSDQSFAIAARAEGYEPSYISVAAIEPSSVQDGVIIALNPETGLRGLVVTSRGTPIPGAAIRIGETMAGRIIARSGSDGAFRALDLEGSPLSLYVEHRDFLPTVLDVTLRPHEMIELPIVLENGGIVSGSVLIGDEPAVTLQVTVTDSDGFVKVVKTNSQGRYTVSGIPAGNVNVRGQAPRRTGAAPWVLQRQAVVANEMETLVDIHFPAFLGSVSGHIVLAGQPVSGGFVKVERLSGDGDLITGAKIAADGTYLVENLPSGEIRLNIMIQTERAMQRTRQIEFKLAEGQHRVEDISFDAPGLIEGMATNLPDGANPSIALLTGSQKVDLDDLEQRGQLDARTVLRTSLTDSGEFILDGIDPGEYLLVVIRMDAYRAGEANASLQQYPLSVNAEVPTVVTIKFEGNGQ
jgi:hypothetical protein